MNPLTKVLRTLRHTSTAWSIIIDPNPQVSAGHQLRARPGVYELRMNLYSGIYIDRYLYDFPTCAGTSNITFPIAPKPLRKSHIIPAIIIQLRFFGCSSESKWVRILDTKSKNEKGETLPEVLVEIPKYDLETKEGAEAAIHDIESKLVGVASFEEFDKESM